MKIRFLMLLMIAMVAVGCSAFFESYDDSAGANIEPIDDVVEIETEKDAGEDRSREETSDESAPMAPPVAEGGDVADETTLGYATGDVDGVMDMPDTGGGGGAPGDFAGEFTEAGELAVSAPAGFAPDIQQVSTLKAGEIDDNAEWDEYLLYRRESLENFGDWVNDVDVSGRQIITVTDSNGLPVLGATVTVSIGDTIVSETRTYADGRTLDFPNANPPAQAEGDTIITVEKDGVTSSMNMSLVRLSGPNIGFTLEMEQDRESVKLDVVFLLDATGSMSDEIGQLQGNILSISQQIDDMGDVDVRYGLVHYRDREDAYVTQVHDFTPDVTLFQQDLNGVVADGGGDTPESLNAGLYDALHSVEWRGADTIKLVFLVADAPPHLDYPDDYDYAEEMLFAGERGIKVHPIASSGLDPVGEYIFRQIGQTTMGRFIFLTYAGGTPGEAGDERPDLEASEQDYTVDFLDGLVVRLVEEEINAFKGIEVEQ